MIKLNTNTIITLHDELIKEFGGKSGIISYGLLDSAINSPFQTFDGVDLYPSMEEKSARLCYNLCSAHCFKDGNKRIGVLAMLTFLEANGYKTNCTDSDLISLGYGVADGSKKYPDIVSWVKSHCKYCSTENTTTK